MKKEKLSNINLPYDDIGFTLFEDVPQPSTGHIHGDIEVSVFEKGSVTMLYAGRALTIPPGQLVVHWGILPHQMLSREPSAQVLGLHLPLAWFLQWNLPHTFVNRILNLEVLVDHLRHEPCSDIALLKEWRKVVANAGEAGQEIVLLELQSRLWRMDIDLDKNPVALSTEATQVVAGRVFERAVEYIAEHYLESIRIPEIAKAAGVSRTHIMRLFKQVTGWTVNGYITHLRLCHAQRLLVTTDKKVIDIMFESGFTSLNRFYDVFKKHTNTSPARYRKTASKRN